VTPTASLIQLYAKQLRLPTFARFEQVVREAETQGWGYGDFLYHLMTQEIENRQENQRQRRIRAAGFPLKKTLDTFDFRHTPHLEEAFIWELAKGRFIAEHRNVVMIGNPGVNGQ
jgi:DNA replication protein DnaC